MGNYVGFGGTTWNSKYPLLMGISSLFSLLSYKLLRGVYYTYPDNPNKHFRFNTKPFFIAWVMSLSESSVFIFYLIQRYRSDVISRDSARNQIYVDKLALEKTEMLPGKNKLKLVMKIIPICLIDCSSIIILSILREGDYSFFELDYRVLLIMITSIYSIFILHFKYYLHHFLSYALLLFGIIGYSIVEFIQIDLSKQSKGRIILFFCLMILLQLMNGFRECYEKYLMETHYVSPHMIVSLEGFAGFVIITLSFIPLSMIECPEVEDGEQLLHCNRYNNGLHVVENIVETIRFVGRNWNIFLGPLALLYFSFMFFNLFRILTNQHCSPIHRGFADIMGYFLYYLIGFVFYSIGDSVLTSEMHNYPYFILGFIFYFFILVGTFIFLEVIIIKWFDLDKNTLNNIQAREFSEVLNIYD